MVYHHDSVASCMHVELYGVCAEFQSEKKGRDRILGQRVMSAAVGYSLRTSMRRRAQYWLAVIGFGTMSAKLWRTANGVNCP
jgi:hypothetical protein